MHLCVERGAQGAGPLHDRQNVRPLPLVRGDDADLGRRDSPAHEVSHDLLHIGGLCMGQHSIEINRSDV